MKIGSIPTNGVGKEKWYIDNLTSVYNPLSLSKISIFIWNDKNTLFYFIN